MKYRVLNCVVLVSFMLPCALYAHGAGVLPLTLKNGELYALLGEEPRHGRRRPHIKYKAWSDFGGAVKKGESLPTAAWREFQEETGYTSFKHITQQHVQNSPYVDMPTGYRLYLLSLAPTAWVSAQIVQNNVITARRQNKPDVDKTAIAEVKVSDLLLAVHPANQILRHGRYGRHHRSIALMPGKQDPLFSFFKEILQTPETQNKLTIVKNQFNARAISVASMGQPTAAVQAPTANKTVSPHKPAGSPLDSFLKGLSLAFSAKPTPPKNPPVVVTPKPSPISPVVGVKTKPSVVSIATPHKPVMSPLDSFLKNLSLAFSAKPTPPKSPVVTVTVRPNPSVPHPAGVAARHLLQPPLITQRVHWGRRAYWNAGAPHPHHHKRRHAFRSGRGHWPHWSFWFHGFCR